MLLGRVTFDIWAAYWPPPRRRPISHGINTVPKYVPSTTLKNPTWENTHVIDGDVEAAVRELKAQPGRDLLLQGSGALLQWLLERDLVDELNSSSTRSCWATACASSPSRADASARAARIEDDAPAR